VAVLCDTTQVQVGDRFDLWSQSLVSSFFPVRVERLQRSVFNGHLEGYALGPLQVFHAEAGGCAPVRTASCVAAGDPEQLQVHLLRRGRCRVTQQDRSCETGPGDITLMLSSRPSTILADGVHELLIFSLPLRLLGPHADRLAQWTAVRLPGDSGLAPTVGPFLGGVVDGLRDGSVAQDNTALADGVVALTRALYRSAGPGPGRVPEASADRMLARIKCYIDSHLHEVDLGPETIASAHFISTRYLHKLFEAEEMTLFRWVQYRRLERCCDDLRNDPRAEESIAAIAARWGFRNRDVFTRLLRKTHGTTPQGMRARARAEATPSEQQPSQSAQRGPSPAGSRTQQ
jgi:AraC-like DNA-binding protein